MAVKVLELSHVAPPQGSVPPAILPLTFFDLIWVAIPVSTERVFLYHLPRCSAASFRDSHLPNLKESLSLALQRFYPLAGRLIDDGTNPHICYSDGDSVVLTVAESDDDLHELASDGPREAARFRVLVPKLAIHDKNQPVVALQATIFPEQGIAIGISMLHAAMDGSSSNHFMRTWASTCKVVGGEDAVTEDLPVVDRSIIPDPRGLRDVFTSKMETDRKRIHMGTLNIRSLPDVVLATFRVSSAKLEKLRGRNLRRCSSFALAVALVWTCLLRARGRPPKETEWVVFAVDCRARHDPPVPLRYFGNCLSLCFASAAGCDLVSEDGLMEAVAVVAEGIRGLEDGGAVMGMETVMERLADVLPEEPLSVAGSPRLGAYGVDFGWGRPAKTEVASIETSGAMSLAENGDGEGGGGLEIGLALGPRAMEKFTSAFEEALN